MAEMNLSEQQQQQLQDELDLIARITMLKYVMAYICLALAVIWLRRHVASKNSSALYLAVLAINDLLFTLLYSLIIHDVPLVVVSRRSWLYYCIMTTLRSTEVLEPLLVLGFSVERLIAISWPLQVRRIRLICSL